MAQTKVIFRVFKNGEVIALFPEIKEQRGCIMSYMHIGQHGSADTGIVYDTRLAKEPEYRELHRELTAIGYSLKVCKKIMH